MARRASARVLRSPGRPSGNRRAGGRGRRRSRRPVARRPCSCSIRCNRSRRSRSSRMAAARAHGSSRNLVRTPCRDRSCRSSRFRNRGCESGVAWWAAFRDARPPDRTRRYRRGPACRAERRPACTPWTDRKRETARSGEKTSRPTRRTGPGWAFWPPRRSNPAPA